MPESSANALNGADEQDGFARVSGLDIKVEVDPPAATASRLTPVQFRPMTLDELPQKIGEPLSRTISPAIAPGYDTKLESLHEALLGFQKTLAAIAPSDGHLRRGMTLAYEAVIEVMKGSDSE